MQFITVASIPIWSAFVRSIFSLERPLQKFPPPMTIPTWIPSSTRLFTCFATPTTVASSKPVPFSPARASPLSFNRYSFHVCTSMCRFLYRKYTISRFKLQPQLAPNPNIFLQFQFCKGCGKCIVHWLFGLFFLLV